MPVNVMGSRTGRSSSRKRSSWSDGESVARGINLDGCGERGAGKHVVEGGAGGATGCWWWCEVVEESVSCECAERRSGGEQWEPRGGGDDVSGAKVSHNGGGGGTLVLEEGVHVKGAHVGGVRGSIEITKIGDMGGRDLVEKGGECTRHTPWCCNVVSCSLPFSRFSSADLSPGFPLGHLHFTLFSWLSLPTKQA